MQKLLLTFTVFFSFNILALGPLGLGKSSLKSPIKKSKDYSQFKSFASCKSATEHLKKIYIEHATLVLESV